MPDDPNTETSPPSPNLIDDPRYWRKRAEDMKAKAEQTVDPFAKASLLEAVKHYQSLAELAEARLREASGQAPGRR